MINPDNIVFNDSPTPSEASEFILSLEHMYILKGKRICDEKVYLAALKAIKVLKDSDSDSHLIDVANYFLLNIALETSNRLKDEYIKDLLKERDCLVKKEPAALRSVIYHLSIPFLSQEGPRGVEIGIFTTFERAELALRNLIQDPIVILNRVNDSIAHYEIVQQVIDCYNLHPEQAVISFWTYNSNGELMDEWFNHPEYNINGTVKCNWEAQTYFYDIARKKIQFI